MAFINNVVYYINNVHIILNIFFRRGKWHSGPAGLRAEGRGGGNCHRCTIRAVALLFAASLTVSTLVPVLVVL